MKIAERLIRLIVLLAMAVVVPTSAAAATATLVWDANTEPDLAGYVIWWGTQPGTYTQSVDVGTQTWYLFSPPDPTATYYFAVNAYNVAGEQGALSQEVFAKINDAPVANSVAFNVAQGSPVSSTLTGSDVNGDRISFLVVQQPAKGTLLLKTGGAGAFTYVPAAGKSGSDGFTFRATDGRLVSNLATVQISIVPLTVAVSEPNGGERLVANEPVTIRWTTSGLPTAFDVELSRDGGKTFSAISGCANVPGTMVTCSWTPDGAATSTARIRVTARSGTLRVTDSSDANFSITSERKPKGK